MLKLKLKIVLLVFLLVFSVNNSLFAKITNDKITFANVIKKVAPAVVSVYGSNTLTKNGEQLDSNAIYDHLFGKDTDSSYSLGSGVIISKGGLIVTNAHVVDQRNNITVVLYNGKEYKAKKLAVNTSIDLALLQVDTKKEKINFLDIVDENDNTEVGDVVLAIGNPFGIGQTVTSGIVSGFRYFEKGSEAMGFGKLIQIDAAINPGNSGGALINSAGDLIGINSSIYAYNNNTANGIGFAIPASVVKLFVKRYLSGGSLKKYWIGLTGVTVDNNIANKLNLQYPKGVFVDNVIANGPAEVAGLKRGDVIVKINTTTISTMSDLSFFIAGIDSSNKINITFIRDGKEITLSLTPEIPKEEPKKDLYTITSGVLKGTTFVNNSPFVAYEINSDITQKGVVIYKLDYKSLLRKLGIEAGDLIMKIGDTNINNTSDLRQYIEKNSNNSYKIVFKRRNQIINLNINSNTFY